jgi:archaellin
VRATNGAGNSAYTTAWSFTTLGAPAIPVHVSPANGATGLAAASVTLDWNDITIATGYDWQYSTDPAFLTGVVNGSVVSSTVNIGPLASGATYYWRVRATNGAGNSAYTTAWSFTTLGAPAVPVHVSPSNGATGLAAASVTLDWNDITVATGYDWQYSTDPAFLTGVVSGSVVSSTANIGPLSNNTTYYWRVRATNGAGNSAYTTAWSFTTLGAPAVPVHVSPANGATGLAAASVTLDWNDITLATGYDWQYSTDPAFLTGVVSGSVVSSTVNIGPLSNNTTYYWRVRATNGAGNSAYTTAWSFTTIVAIPTMPVHVSPSDGATNVAIASVTLDWSDITVATGYDWQYSTDPAFLTGVVSGSVVSSTVNIGPLANGTTYYWRVRATNVAGNSAYTTAWSFTTIVAIPTMPVHVSPADGATNVAIASVTLDWSDITVATGYDWQYSTDPAFLTGVVSGSVVSSTANIGPLANGTTYYWRVRATNVAGNSAYTTAWSFTTIVAIPTMPVHVSPSDGATNVAIASVTLDWSDITVATGYDWQYSMDPAFLSGVVSGSVVSSTVNIGPLANGTTYYWRVRATNVAGNSAYTTAWSFTTIVAIPTMPVHVSPADGATNVAIASVTLDWSDITVATGYDWEYSTDPSFLTGVVSGSVVSSTANIGPLANGTTYYWRVRATNVAGNSAYTTAWSFTTEELVATDPTQMVQFVLWPNPATSELRLTTEVSADYDLQIVDLNGKLIFSQRWNSGNGTWNHDVSNWSTGNYILKVHGADNTQHLRFSIVR